MLTTLLFATALAANPTDLATKVKLGAGPKDVQAKLEKIGATDITFQRYNEPGAFAQGALDAPGLLALLNRAGTDHALFDKLPDGGPGFVTAKIDKARAAYAFLESKLVAVAVSLPYRVVKPTADPFDLNRLSTINAALDTICPNRRVTGSDDYRNANAWQSRGCQGGTADIWYEPSDRDAAVKVVIR